MKRLSQWQAYRKVPASVLPRTWRDWVLDRGSLTKRLIQASDGDFAVRILDQHWDYPEANECIALNMQAGTQALIREVELLCHGEVWVKARSIIPFQTLTGEERQLRYLGTRPLGAFLFKSRDMQRKAIEVATFQSDSGERMYGRRSVFLLHQKPLLVSELFLPAVLASENP